MCNVTGIIFGAINIIGEDIRGKRVVEIGSYDVNGSLRDIVMSHSPKEYVGVDIVSGPGVDCVCDAEKVLEKFGPESFDVVISTELIEHVKDWRKVISGMKNLCKSGGIILVTTRSAGFSYHGYPFDFWRYEQDDMKEIFSDCIILNIERDKSSPGIFIKLRKPEHFVEKDNRGIELYSMAVKRRINSLEGLKMTLPELIFWKARIMKSLLRGSLVRLAKKIFS